MLRRIGYHCCPILNNLENKYCDAAAGRQRKSIIIAKMSETYVPRERSDASSQRKRNLDRGSARRTLMIRVLFIVVSLYGLFHSTSFLCNSTFWSIVSTLSPGPPCVSLRLVQ
jgi:hypothetical protein